MYLGLVFGCVGGIVIVVGMIILPLILNRKFDPIFRPKKGESWEVGKSAIFPYYFYFRSHDYARAIAYPNFAQKKFNCSREFFRNKIGTVTWLLILFSLPCELIMFFIILPLSITLALISNFL